MASQQTVAAVKKKTALDIPYSFWNFETYIRPLRWRRSQGRK
jgi:hypothetical protein